MGRSCDGAIFSHHSPHVQLIFIYFYAIQFQDNDFPSLSGARVVRIATHPDYQGVSEFNFIAYSSASYTAKFPFHQSPTRHSDYTVTWL